MNSLLAMLVLASLAWFWADSLKAREQALRASANACRQLGVQLLDQTVSLASLGLGRTPAGRVSFRRRFRFEFSTDGIDRLSGQASLLGHRVESVHLDMPEGLTILPPNTRLPDA